MTPKTPSSLRLPAGFMLAALLAWMTGCANNPETGRPGGIALSFDDRFINEWHQLRPLFRKYNARVTFYITGDTLTAAQIAQLRELASEGHEIGFHGTLHSSAPLLVDAYGVAGYLEKEIKPGLAFLHRHGFRPTSYAHPGGSRTAKSDSALLAYGFVNLRGVAKAERSLKGIRLYHIPPKFMPHIYFRFDGRKNLPALEIDTESNLSGQEIADALGKAKKEGSVLMLFGHQPLPPHPAAGLYGFRVSLLETILRETRQHGLRYYTMSELR